MTVNWDSGFGLSDCPDVVLFDGMAFARQVSASTWSSLKSMNPSLSIAIQVTERLLVC
jgi:hypothetical protein